MSAVVSIFHVRIVAVRWCSMQTHDHSKVSPAILKALCGSHSNSHLKYEILKFVSAHFRARN